jgi:alpha-tubulin suppressor-like RCC1 family protein
MPFHAQRTICVFSAASIGLLILATHADAQPKTFGWGRNLSGQLGIGTNADTNSPVAVPNFAGAIKLSGGGDHTLALQPDGTVWATGSNISGQLGTGSASRRPVCRWRP